ncbi:hypothetical protein V6N13_057041 [Hibiscus sabdariffa]|uniref:Uncharacterized protein n=1 Tax=Hibiscus sabdariffa TaxID=183260 RepID=A0ABR2D2Q5_9ROSI
MEKHDFDNIIANDPYAYAPRLSVTIGGIVYGSMVNINFCASCSHRGTAITMKKMLETQFSGIDVILDNYPVSATFAKAIAFQSGSSFSVWSYRDDNGG